MSQRTFCDKCEQPLVIPDEKVDFVTGQPTNGHGDLCWQCRLREIVDLYNEKTKNSNERPTAVLRWVPPTTTETWTQLPPYATFTLNAKS